jgi:hypothetical protein
MENSKICSKCKLDKPISQFSKRNTRKIGHASTCKSCFKLYRIENKDKIVENNKIYREKNKDKIVKYNSIHNKKYHILNKKEISYRKKEYYIENRDKILSQINNNREILNERIKNRKIKDPIFKLRKSVSNVIYQALKLSNSSKRGKSVLQFLPYTINELKFHLESQFESWMNWQNWGRFNHKSWIENDSCTWTWQIDHIIPQSDLPYTSMEDENFKKCWALENLRPYSSKLNIVDGPSRIRHKKS